MDTTLIKKELMSSAETELSYYNQLVTLATEQRDILVKGRHSELPENLSKQDAILVELNRVDNRIRLLSEQLKSSEVSDPDGFEIQRKQLAEKLDRTITYLKWLVQMNAELLINAKNYVDFSVRTIISLVSQQASMDATSDPMGRSLVLDQMV